VIIVFLFFMKDILGQGNNRLLVCRITRAGAEILNHSSRNHASGLSFVPKHMADVWASGREPVPKHSMYPVGQLRSIG